MKITLLFTMLNRLNIKIKKTRLQTQKSESNTYHYNRYYGNKEYHLNMPWLMDVNEMWK